MRESIVQAVRLGQLRVDRRHHRAIRDLIVHLLNEASPLPIFVTLPRDPRALAVAQATVANGRAAGSLARLCAGASVRTIQRLFRRGVGLSFEHRRR